MKFDPDSEKLLLKLNRKYGTTQLGKICQCLIVFTFHSLGWKNIRNHISEDADVDAITHDGSCFTFELKTTEKSCITVQNKDIDCLKQRIADGYHGYFLALRVGPQTQWHTVPFQQEGIAPGQIPFARLCLHDDMNLSDPINQQFQMELKEHFQITFEGGLTALLNRISNMGIEKTDI